MNGISTSGGLLQPSHHRHLNPKPSTDLLIFKRVNLPALFSSIILALTSLVSASPVEKCHTGVRILSGSNGQCLHPVASPANGIIVGTAECANASLWDIQEGSGSVILHGTNFALDATTGKANGQLVKLWTSYPKLFQQTWYLTQDRRIAITGGNQCLDFGPNGPQTYQCTDRSNKQVWYIIYQGLGNGGVYPPLGNTDPDPENGSQRLHPFGRSDLCVSVSAGWGIPGGEVNIAACFPNDEFYSQYRLWQLPIGGTGRIRLHGLPELCIEAQESSRNWARLTIQHCDVSQERQTWSFIGERLKLGGAQSKQYCMDLELGSRGSPKVPYDDVQKLQIWRCFPENPQQVFFLH
ncbi:hypothetical protein IAT38_002175 [Cryptococcus sp. DSM 104549]